MNRDASKMHELVGTPHDLAWLCLKIEQQSLSYPILYILMLYIHLNTFAYTYLFNTSSLYYTIPVEYFLLPFLIELIDKGSN